MKGINDSRLAQQRLAWLGIGLAFMVGLLACRLAYLQVVKHRHYLVLASGQHERRNEVPAKRGELYLLDGDAKVPLALNQTLKVLYADPSQIKDAALTARRLAPVIGVPEIELIKKLQAKSSYVVLATKLSQEAGEQIYALGLTGIVLSDRQYRTYPEGSLAAQVAGFVNADGKGQYGVEGFLEAQLAGTPGLTRAKTDTRGNPIARSDNILNPPTDGKSFVLTIDRNIQATAEKFLKEGVDKVKAKSGSVVILDPATGAVKAMANYPTYDPNNYGQTRDYQVFSNATVSSLFEPGSGFKVITMAAGLDQKRITPETTYNDPGSVKIDGYIVGNAAGHRGGPNTTMMRALSQSYNTAVIFVLRAMGGDPAQITTAGKKILHDYITKRFHFGQKTGIEQPGEAGGRVNPPTASDVNYANISFGQGISVTMLQMAAAFGAIANGGTLYQPYLVGQTIDSDGTVTAATPKVVRKNVISPAAAKDVTRMMEEVVENGSGYMIRADPKLRQYKVAGKTGTAQIPKANGAGYEEGKNIGSFTGFAPSNIDPKFVMMVRVDEPKIQGYAEVTTVPIFANIASWLVDYYAVPPNAG